MRRFSRLRRMIQSQAKWAVWMRFNASWKWLDDKSQIQVSIKAHFWTLVPFHKSGELFVSVGWKSSSCQMPLSCFKSLRLGLNWNYTKSFFFLLLRQTPTRHRPSTLASGTRWWWTSARRRKARSSRETRRSTSSSSRSTATALTRSSEPWTSPL